MLFTHIWKLEPHGVHDATLARFINARLEAGAGATTINRGLKVVRTILKRAARAYRYDDGRPWLDGMLPLIAMLPELPRKQ